MSKNLLIPKNYKPILDLPQTERAIKLVKDFFELNLSSELRLRRVTAPLFLLRGTGINDDLNGVERPVSFEIKNMGNKVAEVPQSLAKWKRMMLADYKVPTGYGLYTDMNAIRPDETIDNIHSIYVDQWDWERHMAADERNVEFLKSIVRKIFGVLKRTEYLVYESYPQIKPLLPEEITFIYSEDLLEMYPNLSVKERETEFAKKHGAIFIIGIGGKLKNGEPHDGRAPDYDDWTTESKPGYNGLNGDIIIWNPIFESAFEISSMGIRVNKEALLRQLEISGTQNRKELMFHKRLINGELPQSIGGGLGQSRICMYFLRKAHIGEIQSSIWPEEMIAECNKNNITLI
jgi:aspartate--ammonia ligase